MLSSMRYWGQKNPFVRDTTFARADIFYNCWTLFRADILLISVSFDTPYNTLVFLYEKKFVLNKNFDINSYADRGEFFLWSTIKSPAMKRDRHFLSLINGECMSYLLVCFTFNSPDRFFSSRSVQSVMLISHVGLRWWYESHRNLHSSQISNDLC
jgi:hypothetical protein